MSDIISEDISKENTFNYLSSKETPLSDSQINTDNISFSDSSPSVVTARGTEDGLVLRIDGKADWQSVMNELNAFLGGKKRFFQGGEVLIEWIEKLPTKEQTQDLENFLKTNFSIGIQQRKRRLSKLIKSDLSARNTVLTTDVSLINSGIDEVLVESREVEYANKAVPNEEMPSSAVESLLDRVERLSKSEGYEGISREGAISFSSDREISLSGSGYVKKIAQYLGDDLLFNEEANARVVFGTMRSGQRIETPFSLIVVGDVNPGADLVAGGDIIIMGSLRGTAHAGAYEDENFEKFIFAMQMQPMQLRIGSVISRGSGDSGKGAEVARIDNRSIVVEPYSAKTLAKRNRVI